MRKIYIPIIHFIVGVLGTLLFLTRANAHVSGNYDYLTVMRDVGTEVELKPCIPSTTQPFIDFPNSFFNIKVVDFQSGAILIEEKRWQSPFYKFIVPRAGHMILQLQWHKEDDSSPIFDSRDDNPSINHCPYTPTWWLYGVIPPPGPGSIGD